MIIDFAYFVNVYYRVANCTIKHIILSSIFVYIYILQYRLLSCIIISTKQKAVTPTKSKPPPIKKKGKRIITQFSKRYKTMRRTNSKEVKAAVRKYLLECDEITIVEMKERFLNEYGWAVARL